MVHGSQDRAVESSVRWECLMKNNAFRRIFLQLIKLPSSVRQQTFKNPTRDPKFEISLYHNHRLPALAQNHRQHVHRSYHHLSRTNSIASPRSTRRWGCQILLGAVRHRRSYDCNHSAWDSTRFICHRRVPWVLSRASRAQRASTA